jgi:hypothetical protein
LNDDVPPFWFAYSCRCGAKGSQSRIEEHAKTYWNEAYCWKENAALRAENEKYRKALEKIANVYEPETLDVHERAIGWTEEKLIHEYVKEALKNQAEGGGKV